jgi:phospholipid transport system substrate-binding protein
VTRGLIARRQFLPTMVMAVCLAGAARGQRPPASDEADPAAFIQRAGTELARIVAGSKSMAEKRDRLLPFLDRTVDVDGVARFCLGRYWLAATPEQRAEYLRLFRIILAAGVAGRLGDYQDGTTTVTTLHVEEHPDGITVPTIVKRGSNPPNRVNWLVVRTAAGWRIADVAAEGMSLRLTQRNDYASYLSRNGGDVAKLLQALANRVEQLSS